MFQVSSLVICLVVLFRQKGPMDGDEGSPGDGEGRPKVLLLYRLVVQSGLLPFTLLPFALRNEVIL